MTTLNDAVNISTSFRIGSAIKGLTGAFVIQVSEVVPYDANGASGPSTEQLIAITPNQRLDATADSRTVRDDYYQTHGVYPQMLVFSSMIGPTTFTFGTTSGPATVYNFSSATFTVNVTE